MIEQIVYSLLEASPEIVKAVGAAVYTGHRPSTNPLPSIVVQRGDALPTHHLKGATGSVGGFVRVTVLAGTYLDTAYPRPPGH